MPDAVRAAAFPADPGEIVETADDAIKCPRSPLLVLDRVTQYLDDHGIGSGALRASRIGVRGGSNFTFLLERGRERYVLRRPPRPPLPPSAHDVVREAQLQLAVAREGVRVPNILAVCADDTLLGVPFYVMEHVEGDVITDELPGRLLDSSDARRQLGYELVDTLVEIHAADVSRPELAAFVRPGSYAERQLRRWEQLWQLNATRDLPVGDIVARLNASVPASLPLSVVHGDYRLGNMLVDSKSSRIVAVLDWEMGAVGDARADLGYLVSTYAEPGGKPDLLSGSPVTATSGFPSRGDLVARYEEQARQRLRRLAWFQALSLWKAAVFCEAIYGRYLRGELGPATSAARFETGVPELIDAAAEALELDERELAAQR